MEFTPPEHMTFDGNLREHWKKWKQELEFYLVATEKDSKSIKVKSSILLTCIGPQGREIYNIFSFNDDEEAMDFDLIINKFNEYCLPKRNVTLLRHKFFTYKQKEGQSFAEFVVQLKKLSKDCEFNDLRESLIRDVIIVGVSDDRLRERMLREPDLNLDKALQLGNSAEQTKIHVKELKQEQSDINVIQKVRPQLLRDNPKVEFIRNCRYCGRQHKKGACPAYGQRCKKCNKLNHFAFVCLSKSVNIIDQQQHQDNNEDDSFHISTIDAKPDSKAFIVNTISTDTWSIDLLANDTNMQFKIDTGAQVNVISDKTYKQLLKRPTMKESTIKLTAYNGSEIPVTGQCLLNVRYADRVYPLLFIIVGTDSASILGLKASERLNLIQRIHEIYIPDNDILEMFDDCFDEIGTLPKVHHITVDKHVTPTVHAARKIPIALRDKLKVELDRMIHLDIIEPITEPTEWVSQLVIVEKSNGKLRICLDPRDLNKAIKRHHYKLPTAEELFAEMTGAQYFTKLDASNGYWQIKVDDESSKLLTFSTPFGRYRFKRLPFGIHSASEVFQQNIAEIIEGCPGSRNSQDDIIIWGSTKEELSNRTVKVLEKVRNSGLKLNKSKCIIGAESVTFLGHKISTSGVSPDPAKVKAINDIPQPTCKGDLQRFLGMTAYLAKFIPNLSNETSMLRDLLKNETVWDFTSHHLEQFNNIKSLISRDISLKFFDPKLPTKITCDSSKYGLGATLEQQHHNGWQPIAFKSRSCTNAEQHYSTLERETLAIVFGCTTFHEYLYGRTFSVDSDHKSLKSIFKYNINSAPPRIQRFLLQLQKYDFTVNYVPGKELIISDTLSRAPSKIQVAEICEHEIIAQVDSVISSLPISDNKLKLIQEETSADNTMQELCRTIFNGWPSNRSCVTNELKPYFNHRHELSVVNGIIMKGTRIVIPLSLRPEMKRILHIGHLGIERTKINARTALFWPHLNEEIEDMISSCDTCQIFRNKQCKETLIQHEVPSEAWVKVGTDLFTLFNKLFLVIVDYTSKYFEVVQLPNGKASTVINFTKGIFARHGIPAEVVSDNGPQYSSFEFKRFARQWDFKHTTSSPKFPQSNGLVERTIQTIKRTFRKCKSDGSDPHLALLALRTSVNSANSSAAYSLMKRNLRTLIPTVNSTKSQYDKHARDLPALNIGQTVRFHQGKNWDRLGQVMQTHKTPRSYILRTDKDTTIRRNRRDLLPSKSEFKLVNENYDDEQSGTMQECQHGEENEYPHGEENECQRGEENEGQLDEENGKEERRNNEKMEFKDTVSMTEPYRTRSGRQVRKPERFRKD